MSRVANTAARASAFRPVRAVAGLLVGFALAMGAIYAVDAAGQRLTDPEPELLGELDFVAYCHEIGGNQFHATLLGDDADGWRCAGRRRGLWVVEFIDPDLACRMLHDDPTVEAVTPVRDSPHQWTCVRPVAAA